MFTKNCRICLSDQSDNVTLLFATEQNDVKSPSETGLMYLECLQLELTDSQDYPKHICNYCKLQLSVFHNFMMMAKRSYDKFTESRRIIKSEKLCIKVPEIEELYETYDAEGDARKSVMSEAEYLDSELGEDARFVMPHVGDSIFNEATGDQQEDDNMDDCVVEYLDDDDIMVMNLKKEVIEVKDEGNDDIEEELEDDIISYHSNDDIDKIIEPPTKSAAMPDFYELEMLDEDLEDEIISGDIKTMRTVDPATATHKDYECKQCNFIFSSADQLRQHYIFHPECRLDCDLCGKKFKTQVMYQSHMNVHNGLPAFKCEMCEKTFNFRSNYQTHVLLHTNERPFQCDLCDKGFRSKWDLIIHTRVHNDIRKYECKICGKRFRVSSHLTSHQYTHAEEKLFECDVCHQRYNSPRTLKQHKNTVHSNNYRFYCSQCDKKFKRKHHVISHLKTHFKHPNANSKNAVYEYRDEL